ncbi:MAG: polyprenyl synthetase family protein [Candidatus Omnitrophica bacterium]|nr:polyprenyl synthetase family protein [Candidatus Omnitrophota bacterium]
MLNQLRKEIDTSIATFLTQIKKEYRLHLINPILYESILEFSLRPGKRIRPLLLLLSYLGYAPLNKKPNRAVYNASTCIEFLHNFMLIHDDIIDRSDLRRGKPTMHRVLRKTIPCVDQDKLGIDLAIIAGDIVYALAIDAFLSINEEPRRKEQALKYFIQTAAFTAMGEFIDTVQGVNQLKNIREKDVFLNYSLKTARYTFDCPLVTGAILSGARKSEIRKLSQFGLLIGQAFQIQDDIIGLFETEKKIGKSILSDLDEKKKTLLIVHAARTLKGKKYSTFLKIFNKPKKTLKDLETIKTLLIEARSLNYAFMAVKSRIKEADKILRSLSMHTSYRTLIGESLFTLFQQSQHVAEKNGLTIKIS